VLFAIPITLLGTVSPFAIRLTMADAQSAGKTAGRLYAISTLGSLVGTFLPVVILLPELGTFQTFLLFAGVLFVVALIGLYRVEGTRALRWLWMPVVIAVLSLFVLNGSPLRAAAEGAQLLYEDESAYNYIQVQEDNAGNRYLPQRGARHSPVERLQYAYGRTWIFPTAPYFNGHAARRCRVTGADRLAAGTIAAVHAVWRHSD
jgi:predicted membrane-bound spermidine synthase